MGQGRKPECIPLAAKNQDSFWQRMILPEEEKDPWARAWWDGTYRWFKSPNVVRLEQYRSPAELARIRRVLLWGSQP